MLFYSLAFYFAFRATALPKWVRKSKLPKHREYQATSLCLQLSLLSYLISSVFGSFAYQTQFLVLAGLTLVFSRIMKRELAVSAVESPKKIAPAAAWSRAAHPVLRAGPARARA